jgi:hypothetical protein
VNRNAQSLNDTYLAVIFAQADRQKLTIMLAATAQENKRLKVEEVPKPRIKANELL